MRYSRVVEVDGTWTAGKSMRVVAVNQRTAVGDALVLAVMFAWR
jgi:hypothetical protein